MSVRQTPREEEAQSDTAGKATADADGLIVGQESTTEPVLSVVLPTLNEEEGVEICIESVKEAVTELELPTEIVVSDSSSDTTPEIARELGALVIEPEETGYGNAYKTAFEQVRGEYVAIGDADTTYDFGELPKLFRHLQSEDADLVLGSRLAGEIEPGAMPPLHRYVGNPLLTRFLNVFYDAGVSDAHSGMRVLTADALDTLELDSGGMEFASEMIMDAAEKDLTISEVPITYHERVGEATLDSFSDGWRHVRFMLTNAPGYLFSVPGALLGIVGLLIVALSVLGVAVAGLHFGLHTAIGGVLMAIVGYQIGCLGIFSSVAADPIKAPRDPITRSIRERFTLETGATAGVGLTSVGILGLAYAVGAWTVGGPAALPDPVWTLVASTAIVLGVQTVFSSFFLSMLAQRSG